MPLALLAMALAAASGAVPTVAQMRDVRRVLVIAAPRLDDPRMQAQRATLAGWGQGASDRDVTVVEVAAHTVMGASDDAEALRARYALSPTGFTAVLIGKDGRVAYRSTEPILARDLQRTIDAMPMRRAGQR